MSQAHRARLDHLAGWLMRPAWTLDESAWVLAGVDPETSYPGALEIYEPGALQGLPGVEIPKRGYDALVHTHGEFQEDIYRIRQLLRSKFRHGRHGAEAPMKVMRWARAMKIEPPWLEDARLDSTCYPLLPLELRRPNRSESSKAVRKDQLENSDAFRMRNEISTQIYEREKANDFKDCRFASSGKVNYSDIIGMIDSYIKINYPEYWHNDAKNRLIRIRVKQLIRGEKIVTADEFLYRLKQ